MDNRLILFDIDGVLIYGERFSARFHREYGIPMRKLDYFFDNFFNDCSIGKTDLKKELTRMIDFWKWKGTIDELMDYWFAGEIKKNMPILDYISNLKKAGLEIAVGSNQEKYRANYLQEVVNLHKYFDSLFYSFELGYKKPDPEFYKSIFKLRNLKPEQIIYWDDDETNVAVANELGMESYLFTTNEIFFDIMKSVLKSESE